jgi:hypothetical protein
MINGGLLVIEGEMFLMWKTITKRILVTFKNEMKISKGER